MILIDVEIYNKIENEFELFEALVDTGSTYCVIEKGISNKLGLEAGNVSHLWQMGDALTVPKTKMELRCKGKEYDVEGLIIEIKESFKKHITNEEFCTRPDSPHPLTNRIIVGKSLLDKLSSDDYKELFL